MVRRNEGIRRLPRRGQRLSLPAVLSDDRQSPPIELRDSGYTVAYMYASLIEPQLWWEKRGEITMGKIVVRVDDRLIHGQTIVAWCPTLAIQEIIAIDDESAKNPMLKSIMTISVPPLYKRTLSPRRKPAAC